MDLDDHRRAVDEDDIEIELESNGDLRWTGHVKWRKYRIERDYWVHKQSYELHIEDKYVYDNEPVWTRETTFPAQQDPWRVIHANEAVEDWVEHDHEVNAVGQIKEATRIREMVAEREKRSAD